jgi:hypothetical protein
MANTICYICKRKITGSVFKAYDESLCSSFCRCKLVREYDYTHECVLVKKHTHTNKPFSKPRQEEYNYGFDLSIIDINYTNYNTPHYIINDVYHKPHRSQETIKSYIIDTLYSIITGLMYITNNHYHSY